MRRKLLYLWMLLPFLALGCQAGTSYELLGYDVIQAAAMEAQKGVDAYDTAVRSSDSANIAEYKKLLARNIVKIALSKDETPENAQKLADKIVADAAKYMEELMVQERRRIAWYEATSDNLKFIVETADDCKSFAIYRADVSAQWKTYLHAQARARLAKMPDSKPAVTVATPTP